MAKSTHYLWFYCLILLYFCSAFIGKMELEKPKTLQKATSTEQNQRKCLAQTAKSQLHVRELKSNRGKDIEKYLASCSLKAPNPYCGAFLKWCFDQCQIKISVPFPARAADWSLDKNKVIWRLGKRYNQTNPQMGDVAGFDFYTKDKVSRITHVEMVWEWDDDDETDEFYTIGANTSAPRGVLNPKEGVHLKERYKDSAVISTHL